MQRSNSSPLFNTDSFFDEAYFSGVQQKTALSPDVADSASENPAYEDDFLTSLDVHTPPTSTPVSLAETTDNMTMSTTMSAQGSHNSVVKTHSVEAALFPTPADSSSNLAYEEGLEASLEVITPSIPTAAFLAKTIDSKTMPTTLSVQSSSHPDSEVKTSALCDLKVPSIPYRFFQPSLSWLQPTYPANTSSTHNDISVQQNSDSTTTNSVGAAKMILVENKRGARLHEQLTYGKHYFLKMKINSTSRFSLNFNIIQNTVEKKETNAKNFINSLKQNYHLLLKELDEKDDKQLRNFIEAIVNGIQRQHDKKGFNIIFQSRHYHKAKFTHFTEEFIKQALKFFAFIGDNKKSFMHTAKITPELITDIATQLKTLWKSIINAKPIYSEQCEESNHNPKRFRS